MNNASVGVGTADDSLQTFYQPDENPGDRSQRCPICLQGLPACVRYPNYVCVTCADSAVYADGNPLEIILTGIFGGQTARGTGESGTATCFVGKVECEVGEAKFGGYVMQPTSKELVPMQDVRRLSVPSCCQCIQPCLKNYASGRLFAPATILPVTMSSGWWHHALA